MSRMSEKEKRGSKKNVLLYFTSYLTCENARKK